MTKNDLTTISSTGSHPDEKLLAELRKRKLVEKKCGASHAGATIRTLTRAPHQEILLFHRAKGQQFQHDDREARDRPHSRAAQLVSTDQGVLGFIAHS